MSKPEKLIAVVLCKSCRWSEYGRCPAAGYLWCSKFDIRANCTECAKYEYEPGAAG